MIFLFIVVRLKLTRFVPVRLFIAYSHRTKLVLGFSVLYVMLINWFLKAPGTNTSSRKRALLPNF